MIFPLKNSIFFVGLLSFPCFAPKPPRAAAQELLLQAVALETSEVVAEAVDKEDGGVCREFCGVFLA